MPKYVPIHGLVILISRRYFIYVNAFITWSFNVMKDYLTFNLNSASITFVYMILVAESVKIYYCCMYTQIMQM